MHKIAFIGDSILKGVVLNDDDKYTRLQDSCCATLAGKKLHVEIKNYANFGSTSTKGRERLHRALAQGMDADIALIQFGGNDVDHNWQEVAEHPEWQHLPNTPLARFSQNIADMLTQLKTAGIQPVLLNLPPLDAERYFKWFTRDGLSRANIMQWLGDVNYIYRAQELYSNEVGQIAMQHGVPLIDVRSHFLAERDADALLCRDGIHPNQAGHNMMTDTICKFATRYLLA